MKKLLFILALFTVISCNKEKTDLLEFNSVKTELLDRKEVVYSSFDEVYSILSEYNNSRGTMDEGLVVDRIYSIPIFKDLNRKDLKNGITHVLEGDFSKVTYTPTEKKFIGELKLYYNNYKLRSLDYDYNHYLNDLVNLYIDYKSRDLNNKFRSLVEVYATAMPYWIENMTKWDSLAIGNNARSQCPGIADAAVDAAVVGCLVGSIAGGVAGPPGSAAACFVGAVMSATGATLWQALKCLYQNIQ